MKSVRDYLLDMLDYIGYLEQFAVTERAVLDRDIKTRLAVEKAYEVIGEIAKRLPDTLLVEQSDVPWKKLKGFRDILIHQYSDVDLTLVWQAIQDLPNLRAAVQALLDSLDAETDAE
ncbi:MAG: HepT-like ribonuclease domain-containing protein [Aggregatilineales bacterium]